MPTIHESELPGPDANMAARDPYNLHAVLMPLVRMLADQQLSWSNRQQIAHAMTATLMHHKCMTDEQQMHTQNTACNFAQQAR